MNEALFWTMVFFACIGFLFGVIYPVVMAILYPVYRWRGGTESFWEYIKNI